MVARFALNIVIPTKMAEAGLRATLDSIANQEYCADECRVQVVIVDGSPSRTLHPDDSALHLPGIDMTYLEVSDGSPFEAMNLGLQVATEGWVHILNSGDVYADCRVILRLAAVPAKDPRARVIASDAIIESRTKRFIQPIQPEKSRVNHQCFVYQRNLHERLGTYAAYPTARVSDYLFMMSTRSEEWHVLEQPIAIYRTGGVSGDGKSFYRRNCADYLLGKKSGPRIVSETALFGILSIARTLRLAPRSRWERPGPLAFSNK